MYFSRTLPSLSLLLLLALVLGCGGASAVDVLQEAHDAMKGPSADFIAALASVEDEATAKEALPKLKSASEKMVAASPALEKAMATTSRNAIALKTEINDYRTDQKTKISDHVKRINDIPDAKKVLTEILEKIDLKS